MSLRRRFATPTESHLADITQLLFRSASQGLYAYEPARICGDGASDPDRIYARTRANLGVARASEQIDADYELISKEIVQLVAEGELLAIGDLSDWRHSEVRLAFA